MQLKAINRCQNSTIIGPTLFRTIHGKYEKCNIDVTRSSNVIQ